MAQNRRAICIKLQHIHYGINGIVRFKNDACMRGYVFSYVFSYAILDHQLATMQAIMAAINSGIGRGLGSLIAGQLFTDTSPTHSYLIFALLSLSRYK